MTSGYYKMTNGKTDKIKILRIHTVRITVKIYSYADIAFVGGGFGNPGVHNILEPATFGVPIVIGPNYSHYEEATALVNMGGCISVSDKTELIAAFKDLIVDDNYHHEKHYFIDSLEPKPHLKKQLSENQYLTVKPSCFLFYYNYNSTL